MSKGASPAELASLLARIAGGDNGAVARLYDLTAPLLYARLLAILRRPDWAQEALQDCYLRVWRRSITYTPEKGPPINWLVGVARYRALDLLDEVQRRALRSGPESESGPEAAAPDAEDSIENAVMRLQGLERLAHCMKGLTPEQRRCILLAYYEGYSHQELMVAMNAPLGTVKTWLRRGVISLRHCLARQDGGNG